MVATKAPHLQLVKNSVASKNGRDTADVMEALAGTPDAATGFSLLSAWSKRGAGNELPADELENAMKRGGNEVLRRLFEEALAMRGTGHVGSTTERFDGLVLTESRVHGIAYESVFGRVKITRQAYSASGEDSIHPLDEKLNLPQRLYSYPVQKMVALAVARGPYGEAVQQVDTQTAAHVPLRQMQTIAKDAARHFDAFYQQRSSVAVKVARASGSIVVGGVDCKGIPRRRTAEELQEGRSAHLAPGEKPTNKKMATVASIHTTEPHYRTADHVVAQLMDAMTPVGMQARPAPEQRRLFASAQKSKDEVIKELGEEMTRRDPYECKTHVCLMDGERALQDRTARHLLATIPALLIILDIFHVLGYLWKAAWAFHPGRPDDAKTWVRDHLRALLVGGNAATVAAGIRQSATKRHLRGNRRKAVDKTCNYILNNQDYMRYDQYLAKGLPIASGSVEGACGHLVKDRMERTGALWHVPGDGSEAVLRLRAIDKSGDWEDYWTFHIQAEHDRLYAATMKAAA